MPVQHRRAGLLDVGEVVQGRKQGALVPARPGGRAHPVHDQRVARLEDGRVEDEPAGVDALERNVAPLELSEERQEPLRMLVEDSDGLVHTHANAEDRAGIPFT